MKYGLCEIYKKKTKVKGKSSRHHMSHQIKLASKAERQI